MWPENCYERSGVLQQKFSEKCVKYSDKMATYDRMFVMVYNVYNFPT